MFIRRQRTAAFIRDFWTADAVKAAYETFKESETNEKRNHLIELNSQKQEALTQYLEALPFIRKVDKKTFSIEGKGDLFKRYFTHFEYVFLPQS